MTIRKPYTELINMIENGEVDNVLHFIEDNYVTKEDYNKRLTQMLNAIGDSINDEKEQFFIEVKK